MWNRISVTVEQSQRAIRAAARRHGAKDVQFFESDEQAAVEFTFLARRVRMAVPLPAFVLYLRTKAGKRRLVRISAAIGEYEDQRRQCWKALALLFRAKVYAVKVQARTFDQEFAEHVIGGAGAGDTADGDLDAEGGDTDGDLGDDDDGDDDLDTDDLDTDD